VLAKASCRAAPSRCIYDHPSDARGGDCNLTTGAIDPEGDSGVEPASTERIPTSPMRCPL